MHTRAPHPSSHTPLSFKHVHHGVRSQTRPRHCVARRPCAGAGRLLLCPQQPIRPHPSGECIACFGAKGAPGEKAERRARSGSCTGPTIASRRCPRPPPLPAPRRKRARTYETNENADRAPRPRPWRARGVSAPWTPPFFEPHHQRPTTRLAVCSARNFSKPLVSVSSAHLSHTRVPTGGIVGWGRGRGAANARPPPHPTLG